MRKFCAFAVAFCMMASTALAANKVVRIGIFQPASGDSGAGGKPEKREVSGAESEKFSLILREIRQ